VDAQELEPMTEHPERRELAFVINDVGRLLRTLADQKAAQFGMTRAKWAVLARLERFEGLKQTELAEMLDLQPITLTRLLDGLAHNGLIERRPDANDRRANRLHLTAAARPLLERLGMLGHDLMGTALDGLDDASVASLLADLSAVKENLRQAVQRRPSAAEEQSYG
jgi:MarR family transcriptional regulator for hemolysin